MSQSTFRFTCMGSCILSCVLSILALTLVSMAPHKSGKGLKAYDMSTPENSFRSSLAMDLNDDDLAQQQYEHLSISHKEEQEELDSLKVERESDYHGEKILFVTYKRNGTLVHSIESLEKNVDTGIWISSFESVGDDDRALERDIESWRILDHKN